MMIYHRFDIHEFRNTIVFVIGTDINEYLQFWISTVLLLFFEIDDWLVDALLFEYIYIDVVGLFALEGYSVVLGDGYWTSEYYFSDFLFRS